MATVKIKFRPSTKEDKDGKIYYQIIHERVTRQINSDYKIYNTEWDELLSEVIIMHDSNERSRYLKNVRDRIQMDINRINQFIKSYDKRGISYTSEAIVNAFKNQPKGQTFFHFMQSVSQRLQDLGKVKTSKSYKYTLNSFSEFRGGEDLRIDMLDGDLLEEYQAFLKQRGVAPNTITYYMRNLRATYNRAVEKELVEQRHPFKHVQTSIEKTTKRAIPIKAITQMKELDLSHQPELEFARDMFLFSFYTRGMSFVDISYLKKKDLSNGVLSYRRRKTEQKLEIKWEKRMNDIVKKYAVDDSDYLLPIITDNEKCSEQQYLVMSAKMNRYLKKIAALIDLGINLTMYVARHSWASAAKSKNIPISVISEGMGHDNETTTQIYLSQLDTSVIDKANKMIINSV